MIWRSAVNILWALVRNAFQKGHQCIDLHQSDYGDWTWNCSCGAWSTFHETELVAIKSFGKHVDHDEPSSRRFWEGVSIEGLVRK